MSHPNAVALEAFALGETPAGVADHVATCEACRAYVDRAKAFDGGASRALPMFPSEPEAPAGPPGNVRPLRAVAPIGVTLVTFAIAAALLLALRSPETKPVAAPISPISSVASVASTEAPLVPPGEAMRLSMLEPETRFKGGMSIAIVRERGGDQARFTDRVTVRSGDRLRLEVALDRSEAILGAVLGDDGSWLELMTEGARDAGTHLSERSARVDATPTRGTILVGRAEDVRRARATGDVRHAPGVRTIAIEVEER